MKVLFAVDGSESSFDAVAQVGQLLNPQQDEPILFCAPPDSSILPETANPAVLDRVNQGLVDAIFGEARQKLPAALQANARTIVGTSDARHGIVSTATEVGADLIVLGARGLGAFERLLLGSVSRTVVNTARVPVWVARAGAKNLATGVHALMACENPEQSERLAKPLGQLSWPAASVCHVLTVIQSMFAGKVPDWLQKQARSPDVEAMVQAWAREHDAEIASTRTKLIEFTQKLPPTFARYEPEVAEGEPAATILAKTVREKIDVIVVGGCHKSWLTSTLLGSTSDAVLSHAPCSVLVVPK
jgi:nucleotide-binding universal stress UspA family protein